MSIEEVIEMLNKCTANDGASGSEIASLERWATTELPKPYLDLLRRTNGVEGFVTDDAYLIIWAVGQVPELNEAYSVAEFAPGLILIGTNGGDTGYALDLRRSPCSIMEVPLVGMSLDEAREVGTDFEDFLRQLVSTDR
jgi:SMI1 / KNR4 family (SUKH-1)